MRKLMMTATLFLLAVTFVLAQPGKGQRGPKGAQMFSELELSPEQKEQMKTIRKEAKTKMQNLRGQQDRTAMATIKEETKAAMEAVLTPEQREKLATIVAERKAAMAAIDKEAIKADLKAHREEEVIPVIKAARGQLNQFISAEDQQAIDRLRDIYAAKPGADRRSQKKAGQRGERPSPEQLEARKAEGKAWREAHTAELEEMKALVAKYKEDIKRIQDRMAPQMKAWQEEKREIIQSHLPEDAPKRAGKKGRRSSDKKGKEKEGWPKAAAFLLLKA